MQPLMELCDRKKQKSLLPNLIFGLAVRFSFITIIGLFVVTPSVAQAKQPNILFIITDDQSWDSFNFMGGEVHTPRLNQLANDGLHLTNFNVTSTVCSPSRYSFLTGRYAGRCEGTHFLKEHPAGEQTQVENIGELESHQLNLATVLKSNGYHTGFVGKSHIIRHDWMEGFKPSGAMETYPKEANPALDQETNAKMKRNHDRWCEEIKKYGFDYRFLSNSKAFPLKSRLGFPDFLVE